MGKGSRKHFISFEGSLSVYKRKIENGYETLQTCVKYFKWPLIFMLNSALREKLNFCLWDFFASIDKMFI